MDKTVEATGADNPRRLEERKAADDGTDDWKAAAPADDSTATVARNENFMAKRLQEVNKRTVSVVNGLSKPLLD
jgi:hypothetical protein